MKQKKYPYKLILAGGYMVMENIYLKILKHLKNGKQIKGKVGERSPQQVKIEVTSESKKNVLNDEIVDLSTYRADEVEKVVVRLPKKRLNRDSVGCVHIGCGLIALFLLIFPFS